MSSAFIFATLGRVAPKVKGFSPFSFLAAFIKSKTRVSLSVEFVCILELVVVLLLNLT